MTGRWFSMPEPMRVTHSHPDIELSERDLDMLAGHEGEATRIAMRIILRMAAIQQATELIDISHVHVGGSIYTGRGSLHAVERMVELGATVRVPTTVNAISIDRSRGTHGAPDPEFARNADRLATALEEMGARPVFSCTPYVFPDGPALGDHVLWAESNAIAYANSVIGARTNRHGDFLDVCAAITGRVPRSGLHLPENRRGGLLVRIPDVEAPDPSFFTTLGYLVGKHAGTDVPVIEGISCAPSTEDLKAFCSTVATSGPVGLFHMVGVTPEAPTVETALGGRPPRRVLDVTRTDLRDVWRQLSTGRGEILHLVAFGSPHCTLGDLARLATLSRGRRKHPDVDVLVTTSRFVHEQASTQGLLDAIEDFGMRVSTDTCLCMLTEGSLPPGTEGVMTDSGKFAHYGPGLLRRGVYFGSTRDCVESAVAGQPVLAEPSWLS
ncbi:aconitase X [Geodermatophilus telluris]|uniref:aconitase X n=1 Tax=Geodermatophilus telluris TaxID=1190417 RepID=UPI0011134E89|nr:aconitase X catalytic domain-containing protein [Geodermatophilus telluris]